MKLIGVGFGRSGTMSLKAALESLGAAPCFHMIELITGENRARDLPHWVRIANGDHVDWEEVFSPWEATVDWPACTRWQELIDVFPQAKVLLNVRDFDSFYESCSNTLSAVKRAAVSGELPQNAGSRRPVPELWQVIESLIWQGDFQGRFGEKAWVREMYHARIAAIKERVPSDRLVVWELGVDGWEPLAKALDVHPPKVPFPHLNDTNEFRAAAGLGLIPSGTRGTQPARP